MFKLQHASPDRLAAYAIMQRTSRAMPEESGALAISLTSCGLVGSLIGSKALHPLTGILHLNVPK